MPKSICPNESYTVTTSGGREIPDVPGNRIFNNTKDGCANNSAWDCVLRLEKETDKTHHVYRCYVKNMAPLFHVVLPDPAETKTVVFDPPPGIAYIRTHFTRGNRYAVTKETCGVYTVIADDGEERRLISECFRPVTV